MERTYIYDCAGQETVLIHKAQRCNGKTHNTGNTLDNTHDLVKPLICIASVVGIFGGSAALEGYLLKSMRWYEGIVSAIGGLLLIYPGVVTDVIGLSLVAVVVCLQIFSSKKHSLA